MNLFHSGLCLSLVVFGYSCFFHNDGCFEGTYYSKLFSVVKIQNSFFIPMKKKK